MEKYQKVKVLGKGSFGSAILIKRKNDGALFVVKEVSLLKMSKKERDEARHECTMLQQMQHPNIVRYVEQFENRNNLYIVMEYCDGGDLAGKIKQSRGPMKESSILYYFSQICLAMEYMHSRHILHRDIKTMNVFLMKSGAVKLGDFGISTVLRNTMGMANTVCGTPYYFSPELCRNKPYNNKSDIWALGVLLYECATGGRHPFDGNSMNQLMQRIVKGSYTPLSSQYSTEFRKMVDWCLQKDPAKRPSIKQVLALPIMKQALETLEENLMLATQCRVRLKDIIDFDVESHGGDGNRSPSTSSAQQQRQVSPRSEPAYNGLTPGQAAAMALQQQRAQSPSARPSAVGPKPTGAAGGAAAAASPGPTPGGGHNPHAAYQEQVQKILQRQQQQLQQQHQQLQQQQQQRREADMGVPASHAPAPARQNMNLIARGNDPRQLDVAQGNDNITNKYERVNPNEKFQADMKRVDAIIAKYGRNVDPKAKETIHGYMKRKQEEYMQRQKEEQEKRERKNELRQKELNRVLAQQRNLIQQNAGRSPRGGSPTRTPRASSPALEAVQGRTPEPKPNGAPAFGRDPKLFANNNNNNNNNNHNGGEVRAVVQPKPERRKVVAANSPQLLIAGERPQSPQQRPSSMNNLNERLAQERHNNIQERLRAEANGRHHNGNNYPASAAGAPLSRRPSQLNALGVRTPQPEDARPRSNPLPVCADAKLPSPAENVSPGFTPRQGQLLPLSGQRLGGQRGSDARGEPADTPAVVPRPGNPSPQRSPAQEALEILRRRGSPGSRASPRQSSEAPGAAHEVPLSAENRFAQQQPQPQQPKVSVSTLDTLRGLRGEAHGRVDDDGAGRAAADQLALLKQRHSLQPDSRTAPLSNVNANAVDRFWRGGAQAEEPKRRPPPLEFERSPPGQSPTASPPRSPTRDREAPGGGQRSSVDGYGEMLQHLKELLQKRKVYQSNRAGSQAPSASASPTSARVPKAESPLSTGAASPPALLNTKQPRLKPLGAPSADAGATSDEEAEEMEDDEDFEDAVPLSPVRHAELNDTRARQQQAGAGGAAAAAAAGCDDDGKFYTDDVFLSGGEVEEDGEDGYTGHYRIPSPRTPVR